MRTLKILNNCGFILLLAQIMCASMSEIATFVAEIKADGKTDDDVLVVNAQAVSAQK